MNVKQIFLIVYISSAIFFLAACDEGRISATTELPKKTASLSPPQAATKTPISVTPTPEKSPTLEAGLKINPQDLAGMEIEFWHLWHGDSGALIQELVQEFNQKNEWGIKVNSEYRGNLDQIAADVDRAIENGEVPDVVTGISYQAQHWDEKGDLVDYAQLINNPEWGWTKDEIEDFYEPFQKQKLSNGKWLGVPAQRTGQVLFYNSDWANELGFEQPPESPQAFKEQACAAAQANNLDQDQTNDGSGGWLISTDYPSLLGWIFAFDGEIVSQDALEPDGDVYLFNTPEMVSTFSYLKDLYDSGCAWHGENQIPDPEFVERRSLFVSGNVTEISNLSEALKKAGNRDRWQALPFPSPESRNTFNVYGPDFEIFSSFPERQLAAWLFVKWLLEPEQQIRLVQVTGALPLRKEMFNDLDDYRNKNPQWGQIVDLLENAKPEPTVSSWRVVRWALSDAARQLFLYYFTKDQVPELVKFLDETAHALHLGPEKSGVLNTPTSTPSPSFTPTITNTPSLTPTFTKTPSKTPTQSPTIQVTETQAGRSITVSPTQKP